jgi:hypothetical protein
MIRHATCMNSASPEVVQQGTEWQPAVARLCRCVDDYDLVKQLYRGKASLLYRATCRHSNQPVALKLYRKHKLSTLNWYQVRGRRSGHCPISRACCSPGSERAGDELA